MALVASRVSVRLRGLEVARPANRVCLPPHNAIYGVIAVYPYDVALVKDARREHPRVHAALPRVVFLPHSREVAVREPARVLVTRRGVARDLDHHVEAQ